VTYSDQVYNPGRAQQQQRAAAPSSESSRGGGNAGSQRYKMTFKGEFGETQSVYCEIGMDGLKLVDTLNGSTLETFPLNAISRWAVRDKDTFLFWSAKDAASGASGGKQRQVELKGSARDVSDILDTITAACMQLCEMIDKEEHQRKLMGLGSDDGEDGSSVGQASSSSTAGGADKKGFVGWIANKVTRTNSGGADNNGAAAEEAGEDGATNVIPEGVEYWKQPDYDGWMQSQGDHIKTWRRRWFVLKDGYLFRFLNDKVLPQSKPRGVINLSQCLDVSKPTKDSNQGATIQVTVQRKGAQVNLLLVADSKAERDLWLEIMKRAKDDISAGKEKAKRDKAKAEREREEKAKQKSAEEYLKSLKSFEEEANRSKKKVEARQERRPSAPSQHSAVHQPHQYVAEQPPSVQSWQPPPPPPQQQQPQQQQSNWKVCYTPDGSVYYYNTITGVTQWEAP